MNDKWLQQKGENRIDYIKRITNLKSEYGMTYSEWCYLVTGGAEYSEDNSRKAYYIVEKMLPLISYQLEIDEAQIKKYNDLHSKEVQISKEKEKMKDAKREYYNLVRLEARWEELYDTISYKLENQDTSKYVMDIKQYDLREESRQGILVLSDWHIGSSFNTPANTFNTDVAWKRIQKVITETIKTCKNESVDVLNIGICGDMCNGVIHVNGRLTQCENIIDQVLIASEMLAYTVCALSQSVRHIELYYSVGNHGRVSQLNESIDEENFEYLVWEILKLKIENIRLKEKLCYNVHINKNDFDEIAIVPVFNKRIGIVHGHRDKKQNQSLDKLNHLLEDYRVDELVMGHFHNFRVGDGVIVNGSLVGADNYAQNRRLNNYPSQTLIVYDENGSKIIHDINLKD